MSAYHCPICPLIFQFRTEVGSHIRDEHRSRTDEDAALRVEVNTANGELDWTRLRALQASTTDPSVSLIMATTPAAAMTSLDVALLRRLANRARRRLDAEPGAGSTLRHRLARAVAAAEGNP
ncbi:MAG: hypothetical protein ACRDZY_05445, partial [Acidimicrobiales bacterium]